MEYIVFGNFSLVKSQLKKLVEIMCCRRIIWKSKNWNLFEILNCEIWMKLLKIFHDTILIHI